MKEAKENDKSPPKIIRLEFGEGNVYEGESKRGRPHGKGKFRYENGDVYEGEFKHGRKHGNGKLKLKNGDVYEGEFKNDLMHGQGKYSSRDGSIYEGKFKDNLMHGEGKTVLPNKSEHFGKYREGIAYIPSVKIKNQTVLFIGEDEAWIKPIKRRYKRVLYLKKNPVNKHLLGKLITYPTKGDKTKKKLKIVINEHASSQGKLRNQTVRLRTLNKILTEIKTYNRHNLTKPIRSISIVLNSCYGSNVVYNNTEFQKVLNSFTKAKIDVRVSAGGQDSRSSGLLLNNKNMLPTSKTNGYYIINEFIFNEKSNFKKIKPFKIKMFKTIPDFLEDNYLGKNKDRSETSLDAFKRPTNSFEKLFEKERNQNLNQKSGSHKRSNLK